MNSAIAVAILSFTAATLTTFLFLAGHFSAFEICMLLVAIAGLAGWFAHRFYRQINEYDSDAVIDSLAGVIEELSTGAIDLINEYDVWVQKSMRLYRATEWVRRDLRGVVKQPKDPSQPRRVGVAACEELEKAMKVFEGDEVVLVKRR